MQMDKKRLGAGIQFVLTDGLGQARVEDVSYGELEEIVDRLY